MTIARRPDDTPKRVEQGQGWGREQAMEQMEIDAGAVSGYCPWTSLPITACKVSETCNCTDYPNWPLPVPDPRP